jgi:hypothetical protein
MARGVLALSQDGFLVCPKKDVGKLNRFLSPMANSKVYRTASTSSPAKQPVPAVPKGKSKAVPAGKSKVNAKAKGKAKAPPRWAAVGQVRPAPHLGVPAGWGGCHMRDTAATLGGPPLSGHVGFGRRLVLPRRTSSLCVHSAACVSTWNLHRSPVSF